MLMQTGWIQASHRVTRRLARDPTCLLLSPSIPIKIKQNLKVLKSRRQYNLFLENYPACKWLKDIVKMQQLQETSTDKQLPKMTRNTKTDIDKSNFILRIAIATGYGPKDNR